MRKAVLVATIILAVPIIVEAYAMASANNGNTRYISHLDSFQPDPAEQPLTALNEDFTVTEDFRSHLPIILIDTFNKEIERFLTWSDEKGYMVRVEDAEDFIPGKMDLFENSSGYNALTDTPSVTTGLQIRRRGHSSMSYTKPQYKLDLTTESGMKNKISLLGMEPDDDWVLNGSMIDKSLMRNYLAYTIAAEFMPYVPDACYCEVILEDDKGLHYQGVYLLLENVKQGEGRLEINTKNNVAPSYIVRRDRYDPEGTILNTFATQKNLSDEYLELLYPKENSASAHSALKYVEEDITAVEKVLYSDDPSEFMRYSDYIDVDSFVDYYLVNEFFTNYDAGLHSTYLYKNSGDKLAIGPVWDFDSCLDNYASIPLEVDELPFNYVPCYSKDFMEKLLKRYIQLRKSSLAESHVLDYVDGIAQYLKPAQERDWQRWKDIYYGFSPVMNENGEYALEYNKYFLETYTAEDTRLFHRQTKTYEEELVKMRYYLVKHGHIMRSKLPKMVEVEDTVLATDDTVTNTIFAGAFILLFFATIIMARKWL